MPRRMISLRIDPDLLEATRRAAKQEHRTVSNVIEVALERYLRERGGQRMSIEWRRATDGAYVASVGPYRLEVWYDTQGAPADRGWAWRVSGPDYEEGGPADTLDGAQRLAELAVPVYVYRHQDGHTPEREAGPMPLADARRYIRQRAVDDHGNLSHEEGCPYLYLADSAGRALFD